MKAIIFDGKLRYVKDYPVPQMGEDEALVRVRCAGICNTDLEITKGYLGFQGVLGHEFVGTVEATSNQRKDLIGKRVVGEINFGCGRCKYCASQLKRHCPSRKTLGINGKDGAFAEYVTVPVDSLHVIPDNLTDEEAVFVEPLAATFEILEQIHIKPAQKTLILGDGKLGILIALTLRLIHADVTLLGKHDEKLKIPKEKGVRAVTLKSIDIRKEYDIVVEATGSPYGFELAMEFVKPRGIIILKTTVAPDISMNLAPIVIDEVTIVGSRCGPFLPAISALSMGDIDVKPLITAVYRAEKALEAFDKALSKESLKVILDFR
ncbi:MAG: alcohol dehydrogenase catalytic domain-containing protein [Syntrophorhabdaceae bacterium]|nr:alcohol dehydrogenase catalytic domain-containing protein [Syntrophorhabdaceae bacterium]